MALTLPACVEDVLIGKDCTSTEDQTWDVTDPDQALAFKIDTCRIDVDACDALCTFMMSEKAGVVEQRRHRLRCRVRGRGTTHIKATYDVDERRRARLRDPGTWRILVKTARSLTYVGALFAAACSTTTKPSDRSAPVVGRADQRRQRARARRRPSRVSSPIRIAIA